MSRARGAAAAPDSRRRGPSFTLGTHQDPAHRPGAPAAPRPLRRLLEVLLATLMLALAVPAIGPGDRAAAAEDQPVSIRIDSLSPAVITVRDPTSPIVITGTFTNESDRPIVRPQAFLWRSSDPILDAAGLAQTQASDATTPIGARVTVDSAVDNLFTDDKPDLAAGASVDFSVRATLNDLTLNPADGVYLVGVQAREDYGTTVGRARLYLPVVVGTPTTVVSMASLVLLNSRPSLLSPAGTSADSPQAVLADDHLAAEVANGGRLDRLLDLADVTDGSFAVDPDLIVTLAAMKDGYRVQSNDGAVSEGSGAADAGRWLQRFGQLKQRRDGFRLPYASMDLAALAHARQDEVIVDGERVAATVGAVADLPLLAMPTDGLADATTLNAAATLKPAAYLVSDSVTGGAGPLLTGPDGKPLLTFSASSAVGGPGPDPRTTPTHRRQAFLATSWIEQASAAAGTGLGGIRVISSPDESDDDTTSTQSVPWLRRATLTDLLDGTPAPAPDDLSYSAEARRAELGRTPLRAVADLKRYGGRYADLVTTANADLRAAAVTARAASGLWRGQADRAATVTDRQLATLRDDLDNKVVISGGSRATLTSRNDQRFPLTVTNRLSEPVRVQLRFEGPYPQRLTVKSSDTEPLEPGESKQFSNEAIARTNGTYPVTGRLYTADGSPIGNRWSVQVTATDVSRAGWLIVIGSGLTLIGATAFRIRQVRRERRDAVQSPTPPPPKPPTPSLPAGRVR